jgi:membrane protease YdiL (CAAX protease family)
MGVAIGPLGWSHLLFFGVLLPYAAIRSKKKLIGNAPPKKGPYFQSVIAHHIFFTALSLFVAVQEEIVLFPPWIPRPRDILLGIAALALFVGFMAPRWRRNVIQRERKLWLFMPRNGRERGMWLAISLLAGFGEEVTYRATLAELLERLTGSIELAVLLCAVVFAVSHWVQGAKSMAVIFGFALVFHGLVLSTGVLYVAIGVHIVYDVAAGLTYGWLGDKHGYPTDPSELTQPADAPGAACVL